MNAVSIGIQMIMPKTGTSPQSTPAQQSNEREANAAPVDPSRAPPPAGMGKFVDKFA